MKIKMTEKKTVQYLITKNWKKIKIKFMKMMVFNWMTENTKNFSVRKNINNLFISALTFYHILRIYYYIPII